MQVWTIPAPGTRSASSKGFLTDDYRLVNTIHDPHQCTCTALRRLDDANQVRLTSGGSCTIIFWESPALWFVLTGKCLNQPIGLLSTTGTLGNKVRYLMKPLMHMFQARLCISDMKGKKVPSGFQDVLPICMYQHYLVLGLLYNVAV